MPVLGAGVYHTAHDDPWTERLSLCLSVSDHSDLINNHGCYIVTDEQTTKQDLWPGEGISRVGLFGGTFDPVHRGHLRVVMDVKKGFGLDTVVVIPSAVPPHKTVAHVSSAADRLAMTRLCFENRDGFTVSDVELAREGPSYTIDTVRWYMETKKPMDTMMLIMGADAFFEIHTWRSYREILETVDLVVMKRPGLPGDMGEKTARYLTAVMDGGYRSSGRSLCFQHEKFRSVHLFEVKQMEESSTEIRRRIKNNLDVSRFLLPEVDDYIRTKGLYR